MRVSECLWPRGPVGALVSGVMLLLLRADARFLHLACRGWSSLAFSRWGSSLPAGGWRSRWRPQRARGLRAWRACFLSWLRDGTGGAGPVRGGSGSRGGIRAGRDGVACYGAGWASARRARRPLRSSSAAVAGRYGVGRYGMGWPGTGCNGTGRHGPGRYGAAWPQGRLSWARLGRESVSPGWVLRDGTVRVAAVLRDGTGWGGGGRDGPGRCGAGGGGMVSSGFEPGLLVGGLRLGAEWD